MALKELSDAGPDGTRLGQSSTDKIGFYGLTTPIVRPTTPSAVATTAISAVATTAATSSSPYGYAQAQADAILVAINSLITRAEAVRSHGASLKTNLDALGLQG